MEGATPNIERINDILNRAIDSIEGCKEEIVDIVDQARNDVILAEKELNSINEQVKQITMLVDRLEIEEKKHRILLSNVNKNFNVYSEIDFKEAYDKANKIRIQLLLKREEEKNLIKKRREQEIRLKSALNVYNQAKKVWKSVSVVNEYLKGNLGEILDTVDHLKKKQALVIRMIEAQEEERHKLAMDIHDGPAQAMAHLLIKAELCERLAEIDKDRFKEEMDNFKSLARATLKDLRKTIFDLRPMSLDDLGLISTLERYIENFVEYSGIPVDFKVVGHTYSMNKSIEVAIFRMVQEALNNISKHSKATEAKVIVEFTPTRLNVSIIDNGIGFDMDKLTKNDSRSITGYGLANMRERAELLGGSMTIKSAPSKGTRISFHILLSKEENKSDRY